MRDLERRLEKLELLNRSSKFEEEVYRQLDKQDLTGFERIGILAELGLIDGEALNRMIVQGYIENQKQECKSG